MKRASERTKGKTPLWLPADWPAPGHIKAGTTTRHSGVSAAPYNSFNLASHVGDDVAAVKQNRNILKQKLCLQGEPFWLKQVHGNRVIDVTSSSKNETADGGYTSEPGIVCAILTADCVPILICNKTGTEIAAIHVGWRGFCANMINSALAVFRSNPKELLVWIGPHISAEHYEVGDEVRSACLSIDDDADVAFTSSRPGHWFANLELLVRYSLKKQGVEKMYGSNLCTYKEQNTLFSYRRDNVTGRMVSLIWIDTQDK